MVGIFVSLVISRPEAVSRLAVAQAHAVAILVSDLRRQVTALAVPVVAAAAEYAISIG
jgi:hypothetical protein